MNAIETLNDSITKLTATTDLAVSALNQHPNDAKILDAAAAIDAQRARLDTALNPPAVV